MSRSGTSLVEVLVSAVLLAVGISGCLSTLAVAARFRERAQAREELAAAAEDRLGWFLARGCAAADTAGLDSTTRVGGSWRLERDSSTAQLAIDLTRRAPLVDETLAVRVTHPC